MCSPWYVTQSPLELCRLTKSRNALSRSAEISTANSTI